MSLAALPARLFPSHPQLPCILRDFKVFPERYLTLGNPDSREQTRTLSRRGLS